jgi:4-hydroxy-2-oxoglutarate aldolase
MGRPSLSPNSLPFTFKLLSLTNFLYIPRKMGSICPDFSAVPRGIYCPTITFFRNDETEDIDLRAQAEHARFLIQSGVHGITIHGTTGESVLLSHAERNAITKAISSVRRELNANTTLVVGCSAQSVREIVRMCEDAKANGGQYALVLPPSYWAAASTPTMIENFYNMVSLFIVDFCDTAILTRS